MLRKLGAIYLEIIFLIMNINVINEDGKQDAFIISIKRPYASFVS